MGGGQNDRGGDSVKMCPQPVAGRDAPTVTGNQTREPVLGHRGGEVVADALLVEQELVGHHGTDRVTTEVLRPCGTTTVAVPSGHRVSPALLKFAAEHVSICHVVSMPHVNTPWPNGPSLQALEAIWFTKMTYAPNLRVPPRGVGRWLARAPRYLYRIGLGRILGKRLVLLEHRGRRTGFARQTVLEVVDADSTSLVVAAAWGENSDWFQNIQADPSVAISSGRIRDALATAKVLGRTDAIGVFERYAADHKTAARGLAKAFHLPFGDAAAMADMVPVVRLSFDQPL